MTNRTHPNQGLKRLVRQCHNTFQRAENTDFYNEDDYQKAKRKFVKYCLLNETGQMP